MSSPKRFAEFDRLGLSEFCKRLQTFVITEHGFVDQSLVVSLNGKFGSGKSTFLEMWANELRVRRETAPATPMPVMLSAWDDDYSGDPLLALVSALTKAAAADKRVENSEVAKIRAAVKQAAWFGLGLLNGVVSSRLGVDVIAAGEFSESKNEAGKRPDLLAAFEARSTALRELKQCLAAVFGAETPRAIIMVDELDRCRPDYAIEYLETIKHVFDVRGLIFVLAVDRDQLEASVKARFGFSNFPEYYRKFVHRNIQLPTPSIQLLQEVAAVYAARYVDVLTEGKPSRRTTISKRGAYQEQLADVMRDMKLTLRQAQEVFRIVGHCTAGNNDNQEITWGFSAGLVFMGALSVAKPTAYYQLGTGRMGLGEFFELLVATFTTRRSFEWWAPVLMVAAPPLPNEDRSTTLLAHFKDAGLLKPDANEQELRAALSSAVSAWGHFLNGPQLTDLYQRIEDLKSFAAETAPS